MGIAEELVSNQRALASLPTLYYKVRSALADPEVVIQALSDLISTDPSLAAAVLRIANSAFYGFPRKIETLSRAIGLIGLNQLGDIVLASTLASTFQGIRPQKMDMARFWRGSIRRALLCRSMARHLGERDPERFFILGLLSDMGHLVLYQTQPDLAAIILDMASYSLSDIAQKERDMLGCDFAEVGAALILKWQLPESFACVVRHQLKPIEAGEQAAEAARLNLAISIAEALERGEQINAACAPLCPDSPELSGVDLTLLAVFAEECESQLESVVSSLGL
ncbi:HDOD domain-containing protein [Uliginosibacterium gangwonense]|uniref:HDOD domain-containing protein n=1 Tax=Uliginosibacterium gangwonense TaxID=392736 RepID=UPI00037512F3|nr:HDOD domain-containing protein [Uliginosibacterium gangwonense]